MNHRTLTALAICLLAFPAFAQEGATAEEMASEEETARVNESLARIGCRAANVEKETAMMFEVDDAECEIGQYAIELDGDYAIASMIKDS